MSKSLKFKLGINIIEAKKEVQKFVASANKSMQGLKTEIKLDSAAVKSATNKIDKVHKESEESVKRHNKLVEKMRKDSLGRIERSEIQSGASHIQSRRKYMQRLEEIVKTSNQRSLEDTRRMIRLTEAEYAKVNRMELASTRSLSYGRMGTGYVDVSDRTRNLSRQVNVMFNVQQAIEDFSFAGMRGASNNLAAMAATLGGPAGIIAMLGLAGYGLYNIGSSMGFFGEKTQDTNDKLRKHLELLQQLRDEEQERRKEFSNTDPYGLENTIHNRFLEGLDLSSDNKHLKETEQRSILLTEALKGLRDQAGLTEGAIGNAWWAGAAFLDGTRRLGQFGLGENSQLHAYAKAWENTRKQADEIRRNFPELANLSTKDLIEGAEQSIKAEEEKTEEARNQQRLNKERLKDLAQEEKRLKNLLDLSSRARKDQERMSKANLSFSGLNTDDLPKIQAFMDQQNVAFSKYSEEANKRRETLERELQVVDKTGTADDFRAKFEELAEHLKVSADELEIMKQRAEGFIKVFSTTLSVSRDLTQNAERLAQSTERAAKAAWERVKALKAEKQSGQFSFESAVFGAQNTIIGKQAEEALEQRRNMLGSQDNYLKRDEMMVKFMFGDNERTRKLIQERAKVISKQYEHALKSIEDTVDWQRRVRTNTLLNERIDVLKDRSAGQAKGGDFKGSIESLSEVQNLLLGAMGNAGTSTQMTAFLNKAKEIQKEIDKMHDRNIQRETERADKAQQMADQARELRDNAVKTKEAIESLDPNANGAMDRLLEMQLILEKMRTDAEAMEALFEAQQNVPVAISSPLPNFMAGNAGRPGGMSNTNVTNITVGSVNTAATSANSLATDIYSKAKRQGIMMS